MRRGDLDAAGAEFRFRPHIAHQRDFASDQRQAHPTAVSRHFGELDQAGQEAFPAAAERFERGLMLGLFLFGTGGDLFGQFGFDPVELPGRVGMDRHGGIAEHRFRARGGDGDELRFSRFRVDHRVIEIPEMAVDRFVENFVVAHGGLKVRVPVD